MRDAGEQRPKPPPEMGGDQFSKMLAEADSARSIALEVVDRIQHSLIQQDDGDIGPSLAGGHAGQAVLLGYLDRCDPNHRWDGKAHATVLRMDRSLAAMPAPSIGLFGGLAGVAFSLWYLSFGGVRYRRARAAVDNVLLPQITELAASFASRRGMAVEDYDLISGLCGAAVYLLCPSEDDRPLSALGVVVAALAEIVERNGWPPAWFTPDALVSAKSMIGKYPAGSLNCGLAHGAAGIVSVLALAYRAGVPATNLRAALERLAQWLLQQRQTQHWGLCWPAAVGIRAADEPTPAPMGWCYGNPGVARALWLAGHALSDQTICGVAIEAMRSALLRPGLRRSTKSPAFCHGLAGLLHITMRFSSDTSLAEFQAAADGILKRLLALFSADAPFGFRDHDEELGLVDRRGLLDGAAGIALVLLAASSHQAPDWDRMFLLS